MGDEFFAADDKWWRWSKYVITEGYICPAPGAILTEYPVWELYRESRKRYDAPPYFKLLELVDKITRHKLVERVGLSALFDPGIAGDPTAYTRPGGHAVGAAQVGQDRNSGERKNVPPLSEAERLELLDLRQLCEREIVTWCNGHGLLGLLLARTLSVFLPLVKKSFPQLREKAFLGQPWYLRTTPGWVGKFRLEGDTRPPSGVIRQAEGWREEPLAETWGQFFPSVPKADRNTFQYPLPLSKEFWKLYAEPVGTFFLAALQFGHAIDGIAKVDKNPSLAKRGVEMLHELTETVRPAIFFQEDKTWEQTWVACSLISSFAMMALLDRLEGMRVYRCERCKKAYWSKNPRARYCAETRCRWVAQKRRQRGQPIEGSRPSGRPSNTSRGPAPIRGR